MSKYKQTEWEYSNEVDKTLIPIETGIRSLSIVDASLDPEANIYKITVDDIETQGEFILQYWLDYIDKNTGMKSANKVSRGTLISLGRALFGDEARGIPAPCDITGGVVRAEVKLQKSTSSDTEYPRVYKFMPATRDVVEENALIDQYYVDQ